MSVRERISVSGITLRARLNLWFETEFMRQRKARREILD
jgi:hypothetical protein